LTGSKVFQEKVNFIWSVADILRGDFKPHEYGQIVLPFVVLRRLECALAATKKDVIAKAESLQVQNPEVILQKVSGHSFYNTSQLDLGKILQDPNRVCENLLHYIHSFSPGAFEVLEQYGFAERVKKLDENHILYQIVGKFADLDLSEEAVPNLEMGYIFEELLRKFSEMSNETAGEHYTPREVIRLMVNILFSEDGLALTGSKPIRSLYDPACGTGGMLSVSEEYLKQINPGIELNVFGQELNGETWAMCRSDLMIKGQDPTRIAYGNSLTDEDGHAGSTFDYCISNPPYGVDWKKYQDKIVDEAEKLGTAGRYGAGLPRIDDGSFLFVQHMVSKMKPTVEEADGSVSGGSRIAVILGGGTLFSGAPGSGDAKIRRWLLESDLVEGVIALPDKMFYNTEIGTYLWVLTNRKPKTLRDRIKLVDARSFGTPMRKPLGDKRKELSDKAIADITRVYQEGDATNKYFATQTCEDFGYARFVIERPKVTEQGLPVQNKKGEIQADSSLRDHENLPLPSGYISMDAKNKEMALQEVGEAFLNTVVRKHFKDAWIDYSKTKIAYEIPIWRLFYEYEPPQNISELLEPVESEIMSLANDLVHLVKDLK